MKQEMAFDTAISQFKEVESVGTGTRYLVSVEDWIPYMRKHTRK